MYQEHVRIHRILFVYMKKKGTPERVSVSFVVSVHQPVHDKFTNLKSASTVHGVVV